MEKVSEIRSEIARNSTRMNKILLRDLREVSRIFAKFCSDDCLSDEEYYRYSIIKNAILAKDKDTDRLRRVQIISNRVLGGIKPCAGAKRGVNTNA